MLIELPPFEPTLEELRAIVLFAVGCVTCIVCARICFRWYKEAPIESPESGVKSDAADVYHIFGFFFGCGVVGCLIGVLYNALGAFWPGE